MREKLKQESERKTERLRKKQKRKYINLPYFPLTDSSEQASVAGERERGREGDGNGKERAND